MDRRRRRVGFDVDVFSGFRLLGKPLYYFLFLALPSGILLITSLAARLKTNSQKYSKGAIRKTRKTAKRLGFPKIVIPKISLPPISIFYAAIFLSIIGILWMFYFYIFKDLPTPYDLKKHQPKLSTHILDRNEQELYKIYKDENRSLIKIDELPSYLIDATVSIEDKEFWNHAGFSPTGIIRAIYHNWFISLALSPRPSTLATQGGSTITQQLIKNTLLTPEKTIRRKVRELILSVWVERVFSKKEILEMYLNEVSFGGTAYGIQEASQQYFGKNAVSLSLAEAALLAGLPAAPTAYSPFGINQGKAKERQADVLRRMAEDKNISAESAEEALREELKFSQNSTNIKAPHFVMYVRDWLASKFGEDMVNNGGLKVITTLDLDLQEFVQKTVTDEVASLKKLKVTNGAALVTDPKSGEILSLVGSQNYFDFQHDGQVNVVFRPRQPGSSIKPIMYAAAFQKGFTPASVILDAPISFSTPGSKPYSPVNYDGKFHGPIPIRTALASSYNVPAVKVLSTIGVNIMIDQGEAMGINTWGDRKRFGLSLTLGGGEITMADMAEAYGTIANYGVYVPLNPILKVENSQGKVLFQKTPNSQNVGTSDSQTVGNSDSQIFPSIPNRAMPAGVAFQLIDILSDPIARAPAFGTRSVLNIPGHQVAVKTGTTNNLRDNWTFGFTTDFVVSAWVGNNDNSPMSYIASGITGASPIWSRITQGILSQRKTPHVFPQPQDLVTIKICALTGQLACEDCPVREEFFIPGTEPKTACRPETIDEIRRKQEESKNKDRILDGAASRR
ncbi:transglycosylase domain-containing protein [Candidatus Collierbacteria bacterium]|nr:transglycosylase domain-containing protein [Candidatus Collierbacteria bacterium]